MEVEEVVPWLHVGAVPRGAGLRHRPSRRFCLDARDGSEKWFQRVEGPFSASPVIADGKLYLVNEGGTTTVLKLGDKPEVLSVNEVKERPGRRAPGCPARPPRPAHPATSAGSRWTTY